MNRETGMVFRQLIQRGWIDRSADIASWEAFLNSEVQDELSILEEEIGYELFRTGDRVYLIPTDDGILQKNNADLRRDIKGQSTDKENIYLISYLAMFVLYIFFRGEDERVNRNLITKEDLIAEFTEHCKQCISVNNNEKSEEQYSKSFIALAHRWLAKTAGEKESLRFDDRFGCINRLMVKFRADDLFVEGQVDTIKPTQKTKDLMPYLMRKGRLKEIEKLFDKSKEEKNADDQ